MGNCLELLSWRFAVCLSISELTFCGLPLNQWADVWWCSSQSVAKASLHFRSEMTSHNKTTTKHLYLSDNIRYQGRKIIINKFYIPWPFNQGTYNTKEPCFNCSNFLLQGLVNSVKKKHTNKFIFCGYMKFLDITHTVLCDQPVKYNV